MVGTAKPATKKPRGKQSQEAWLPAKRLFTVEEYLRLEEVGILHEDDPIELIEGEIVLMAPQGPRHVGRINWLIGWFAPRVSGRAVVSVQSNIRLSSHLAPE